jgi:hypothetical protein
MKSNQTASTLALVAVLATPAHAEPPITTPTIEVANAYVCRSVALLKEFAALHEAQIRKGLGMMFGKDPAADMLFGKGSPCKMIAPNEPITLKVEHHPERGFIGPMEQPDADAFVVRVYYDGTANWFCFYIPFEQNCFVTVTKLIRFKQ